MAVGLQQRLIPYLAMGVGVGLEVEREDLRATVVRMRPGGITVLGTAHVPRFRERPAAEWGVEYNAFLRRLGVGHIAATVLLPREDVIVRQLALPGVNDKDLANAITFQVDSLHPYPEEDVAFSYARLGSSTQVLVAVVRRSLVDQYSTLFAEAGIKIASLTVSAAAIYKAMRVRGAIAEGKVPEPGFLATCQHDGAVEVYGESLARPVFSALLDLRALGRATAELRLPQETEPQPLTAVLPQAKTSPEGYDAAANALPYATALASVTPWLGLSLNLLPEELRRGTARGMYIPSMVLGSLLLLMLGALAAQSSTEDRNYVKLLEGEIAKLQPRASQVALVERQIDAERARIQLLDSVRRRTTGDMEALRELTKLVPPPGWISTLELTRTGLDLGGESDQATSLLKTLDNSPLFQNSQFTVGLTKAVIGDAFRLKTTREQGAQ